MKKHIAILAAAAGLFAVTAAQAQDTVISPQQTIQLRPNAYGCLSKDKFDSAYQHSQAGEQQQMQEYFTGYECLATPENASFRVVRVVGHDVEFVNAGNADTEGLWTNDKFIKQ